MEATEGLSHWREVSSALIPHNSLGKSVPFGEDIMGPWGIEVWGLVWECTRVEGCRGRAEKRGGTAAKSEAEAKTRCVWRQGAEEAGSG